MFFFTSVLSEEAFSKSFSLLLLLLLLQPLLESLKIQTNQSWVIKIERRSSQSWANPMNALTLVKTCDCSPVG